MVRSDLQVPMIDEQRRQVLRGLVSAAGTTLGVGASLTACAGARPASATPPNDSHEEAEVTPGEDLMQEHGVIERVLLVYDEAARRLELGQAFDLGVLSQAAALVRRFVEDYHERLEEQFVFPRLEAAGRELPLVATLREQHRRGRELTDALVRLVGSGGPPLVDSLRHFVRMYRPHAAREDTVLFPAFRGVVGRGAYRELGEQFEEQEHARFGERGFQNAVAEVARLEAALGIGDLASFTAP